MAKTLIISSQAAVTRIGTATNYGALMTGTSNPATSEVSRNPEITSPGVVTNLGFNVSSHATGNAVMTSRVNVAPGGITKTITGTQVGWFEGVGSDTIAGGENYAWEFATTSSITWNNVVAEFKATTGTVTLLSNNAITSNAASVTRFHYLSSSGGNDATVANVNYPFQIAGTFKNLYLNVTSNTNSTSAMDLGIYINAGTTSLKVSVAASGTGELRETTATATVAIGDTCSFYTTRVAGAGTTVAQAVGVEFHTTTGKGLTFGCSSAAVTCAAGVVNYHYIGGQLTAITVEATVQSKIYDSYTFSELQINITANASANPTPFKFRIDGASGNQFDTAIGAGATGLLKEDSSTDAVVAGQFVNFMLDNSGGTGTVSYNKVGIVHQGPVDAIVRDVIGVGIIAFAR